MAKSIRSKSKKRFRALKRKKWEGLHKQRFEKVMDTLAKHMQEVECGT